MKYGAFVQVWQPDVGMRPVSQIADDIVRAEQLGYDSAWIMDHILIERPGGRGTGHDPLIALANAVARTSRIKLGPLVLGGPFRPVWQLAREGAALADASGGRFILGLGAGWHQPEFEAFGIPFDHLVGRLEEQVSVLKDLLDGQHVTLDGRYTTLEDAEIMATAPRPPIWIAGKGPRMLRLIARCADGWNIAWGNSPDTSWMSDTLAALRGELEAAGRDPGSLTTSVGVNIAPGLPDAQIRELAAAYEGIGIDVLIMSFNAQPGGQADPEGMARAAGVLGVG
jgi:alkanesulfonate monooxygenase SsuD/methylene tetrahydromethanopterin reductase-like flavin-dependent oxidoreductase (luciferase family)